MVTRLLVWLALLAAFAGAPAAAQSQFPPRPEGPVHDGANIIPDVDERLLDGRLRDYNARTGRALIVATVPDLGGETVETYAETLFNDEWGIGGAETDAGLLLLVAPNERKVRIETGYGLQEYVTDILAGRIIRDDITPRFKDGDFAGGINAGVEALIAQLDRDPAEAKAIAEAAAAAQRERGNSRGGAAFAGLIFPLIMFGLFMMLSMGRRVRGKRYRGGGAAGVVGDVLLWTAINAAMNSGRGGGGGWSGGGGGGFGGGGGGFGGFGGGMSGGGGASGSW